MGKKRHCLGVPSYLDICELRQNGLTGPHHPFGAAENIIFPASTNGLNNLQNGNMQMANGNKENGNGEHIQFVAGPQGPTGPTGPIGPTGPRGPQGNRGIADRINILGARTAEPGMPAEIIDDYANNIHSLTFTLPAGPTGPKGDTGERGEKGERGERGADGSAATSAIASINNIVSENLAGEYFSNLQRKFTYPLAGNDISVNTDSITINTPGTYYISLQGYIDATQTQDETLDIIVVKNGRDIPETLVSTLKGQFISYNRGTFQEFDAGDNLQFSQTGETAGRATPNLIVTIIRINLQ